MTKEEMKEKEKNVEQLNPSVDQYGFNYLIERIEQLEKYIVEIGKYAHIHDKVVAEDKPKSEGVKEKIMDVRSKLGI